VTAVLVDIERLDTGEVAEVRAACATARASFVPMRDAREAVSASGLIVGALRRGERRLSAAVVELMEQRPEAGVLLISEDPLIRPVVATHGGRVTLLSRPATPARLRGTVRMLLPRPVPKVEHLDPHVWTAIVGPTDGPMVPAVRHDAHGVTAVFPLEPGWSGAHELCEEVDLIAQARIDEEERLRRLRELLGNAAGMLHLDAVGRAWVAYWPAARCPLLLCSPMRLPRVCNIAEAASRNLLALGASSGDLAIAMASPVPGWSDAYVGDGGAAYLEHLEARGAATPGLVMELR
jgi:hypothetical protein